MSLYLIKSYLSIIIIMLAFFASFTMFEVFGRQEKRFNIETLKKIHRTNGIIFILMFIVVGYLCLKIILDTKAELSARAVFHSVFAMAVAVLLALKVIFIRIYKQFYGQVKTIGLTIVLLTIGMAGTSGGYYLLITKFGTEPPFKPQKEETGLKIAIRTDVGSIKRGQELYESKCYSCHDPFSNKTIIGPGHKGILKNPRLPVSGRPATAENILNQLRNPYQKMPRFDYLSDDEALDIIAYLNTL